MFEKEYTKLQEIHDAVVKRVSEKGGQPPPVARICLDNLNVAGMCLSQLAGVYLFLEKQTEQAVAEELAKKGVVEEQTQKPRTSLKETIGANLTGKQ
jgi:hypothetical protein